MCSCVGLLSPLDCPHHMRMEEHSLYREGVVLDRPSGKKREGSYADCGMRKVSLLETLHVHFDLIEFMFLVCFHCVGRGDLCKPDMH